jgi:hypothetical protein
MYFLGTCFVSGICVDTLHKGENDDDNDDEYYNNNNNNNNNSSGYSAEKMLDEDSEPLITL